MTLQIEIGTLELLSAIDFNKNMHSEVFFFINLKQLKRRSIHTVKDFTM